MSQSVVVGGQTYPLPDVGERSWGQNVTDYMVAVATVLGGGGGSGGISLLSVTSSPVNIASGTTYLVNTTAARQLNLPSPSANAFFGVRDVSGLASTNNITIHRFGTEQIDGVAADRVLNTSTGYWIFACDGTDWFSLVNYPITSSQIFQTPLFSFSSTCTAVSFQSGNFGASSDGTAAAPVFTRNTDSDTGLFFSGANTLGLSTGATEALRVDSAQRLLVATTTAVTTSRALIFGAGASTNSNQTISGGGYATNEVALTLNHVPTGNAAGLVIECSAGQATGVGGTIGLAGRYDTDNKSTMFSQIRGSKLNSTATNREGRLELQVANSGGSLVGVFAMYSTGLVLGTSQSLNSSSALFPQSLTVCKGNNTFLTQDSGIVPAALILSSTDEPRGNLIVSSTVSTGTAQDQGGVIGLGGVKNTGSNTGLETFATIAGRKTNASNTQNGYLTLSTNGGSGPAERMRIDTSGFVGISQTVPTSTLHVVGSISKSITTVSATTTLDATHYTVLVDASGAARTINLPAAAGCVGRIYIVKKVDSSANSVTLDANASETIDGATTQVLTVQYQSFTIQSNGTSWYIL